MRARKRKREQERERERSVWIFRGGLRVEKGKKMKKKTTNVFLFFLGVLSRRGVVGGYLTVKKF